MGLFDFNLFEVLGELLKQAVYMLLYPFISLFETIISVVIYTVNQVIAFFQAIIGLGNNIYSMISNTIGTLLPNVWTALILLGIGIVIILRLYYFLKDVEILGNKI